MRLMKWLKHRSKQEIIEQRLGIKQPMRENRRATDNSMEEMVKGVLASQKDFLDKQASMERSRNFWSTVKAGIWGIAILSVVMLYSMGFSQVYRMFNQGQPESDYTAFVNIEGTIASNTSANANAIIVALRQAFKDKKAKGITIRINSPGGSPVQSAMVYDYIMRKKKDYDRKVIVVAEDIVASGGYFIASAADEIYINKSTMAGSIGVKIESFGLNEVIDKLGIERRIFANNPAKVRGDMYTELSDEDKKRAQQVITQIHNHFIASVEAGRGDRLKGSKDVMYSGDAWTGEEALAMGLVDGFSDLQSVMEEQFGVEYIRDYTMKNDIITNLIGSMSASVFNNTADLLQTYQSMQPQLVY